MNDYNPSTLYGQSKVFTESIVKEFEQVNWVLVRPTSIWGPWFGTPYFDFFRLVRSGKYFNLPTRRSAVKTYGYVKNTCHQIRVLLTCLDDGVNHNCLYLGDSPPINVSLWADLIRKVDGKSRTTPLPIVFFKLGSLVGDVFNFFGLNFPLTSFRLGNMTTSNIVDLDRTMSFLDNETVKCIDGNLYDYTKETIMWIDSIKLKL
jgi:nucleoside-diphosphate-sugar epimerase